MWEIPFYLIVAPILTLGITLLCSIKFNMYILGSAIVFILLNVPTITLPFMYNVGWRALFGWALFYTIIALIISLIVRVIHDRKTTKGNV